MNSTVEKISSNQVKISFDVEAEAFEQAIQKAYLKERGRINIPGFRKGKAPRKVIENMYGTGVFYEQALDILFPDIYPAAIEQHKLKVVDRPSIDITQMEAGQPLQFTAEVYVRPEVTLGQYKDLGIERGSDAVDEDAVDQEIERVRQRNAREIEVEDRPVQDDDIVQLNYAGTVDGVAFDGGTAENQTLTIGSGSFIPGFEEQMVGMAVGEEKDLTVTFPEEYHAKELAGKEAVFHAKVLGIKVRELPELDDEFAKDVSEFDTLDAYKASVRAKLEKESTERVDNEWENALVEAVAQNAQMEIPKGMIEAEVDNILRNMAMRMAYQGLRMEDFLRYTGQTEEAMREQYTPEAEKRVRAELALEAVAQAESIVWDEESLEKEIATFAEQNGQELYAFKANLNEGQLESLREYVVTRKVIDLLKQSA